MKILFGTIFPSNTAPERLPEIPADRTACLAVSGTLLFASPKIMKRLTAYLCAGGKVMVTDAVEAGLANQIFLEERTVRIPFIREFRSWCQRVSAMGIREIELPLDVTAIWRQPAIFTGLHALLGELAGIFLEQHLLCRLPLNVPQPLNARHLAEFHRMLVPGAYSWRLNGSPSDAAAAWAEPLRFYADCWSFPAGCTIESLTTFLNSAGRCAPSPVKVYLPDQTNTLFEPELPEGF